MHLIPKPAPISNDDWEQIEPWVAQALRRAKASDTAEDYRLGCEYERRQLWHVMNGEALFGVVITEIFDNPLGKTVAAPVLAGRPGFLKHALPVVLATITAWARDFGVTRLEATGRTGWMRTLTRFGWTPVRIVMEKDLA